MLLDPTLPEKQRARRRLVGAIALVVAAIVILPMLLDSHPKPVTDDISIDIPNRPVAKASTPPQDTQAGVAPDRPSADAGLGASSLAAGGARAPASSNTASQAVANGSPSQSATQSATTKSPGKTAAAQSTQSTAMNPAPVVPAPAKPAKPSAPTQSTESTARTAEAANADSGTPAAPAGSRFALQLGVFPDDTRAKTWAAKLKAAGVPAYTERRKEADGTTQTLLRAGPFPDRASASAAIAKVRAAGLVPSNANNGAAQ